MKIQSSMSELQHPTKKCNGHNLPTYIINQLQKAINKTQSRIQAVKIAISEAVSEVI